MASADAEIETLKAAVSRYFSVYGVVVTPLALTFQVTAPDGLDAPFDGLRRELVPMNYIPTIGRERGETLIHVQRRPVPRFARREVNLALLVLTIVTMAIGGAVNWAGYVGIDWPTAEAFGLGFLFFGLPLLTILGAHEMGHYFVARRYHVHASLPFFLPSFPPLGTFGAFISMRDPIPNRRALLDIGVSGPLVGFAIAIPVTLAGLGLSAASPVVPSDPSGGVQLIQASLLFEFLSLFFPLPTSYAMHPLAFAGWVGLFVTAINLLPAGQLDGGHVARALLGRNQHYLSWAAVIALFFMGTRYSGWFIFAFLIMALGLRHPPPLNDLTRLDPLRKLVGVAAVVILLITFIPVPFTFVPASADFGFRDVTGRPIDTLSDTIALGGVVTFTFLVNNTGGLREDVRLEVLPSNLDDFGWTFAFTSLIVVGPGGNRTVAVSGLATPAFRLNASDIAVVELRIGAPGAPAPMQPVDFLVQGDVVNAEPAVRKFLSFVLTVV
ncbi:MAG: site-2 protease family protein [Methanobacteriota archaeon]